MRSIKLERDASNLEEEDIQMRVAVTVYCKTHADVEPREDQHESLSVSLQSLLIQSVLTGPVNAWTGVKQTIDSQWHRQKRTGKHHLSSLKSTQFALPS